MSLFRISNSALRSSQNFSSIRTLTLAATLPSQTHSTPVPPTVKQSNNKTNLKSSPSTSYEDDSKFAASHIFPGMSRISSEVMSHASGMYIYSMDGKKYLDFTAGIGVTSTGHSHPKVVAAVSEQSNKLVHAQQTLFFNEPMVKLMRKLLPVVPKGIESFFFANSGAEAVEIAIKAARMATKKTNIIAFQGGYHGRTVGAMSLTSSKNVYSAGMGPMMPGVFTTPFPYSSQLPRGLSEAEMTNYCIEHLERLLVQQSAPTDTAAIIIEPVLGEGGYVVAPKEFMTRLKSICDKHNILLIADEIQSGFGRTGKMFAMDHFGITPDILLMAKGIASGYPFACLGAKPSVVKSQSGGSMGGTYGGNAVCCAAAVATLEVFEEEKLIENSVARGKQLKDGIQKIITEGNYPVKEIRGLGLMLAIEFDHSVPHGDAAKLSKKCFDNGLLLLNTSAFEVLRFIPALTVTPSEIEKGLTIFSNVLREHFSNGPHQ